MVLNDALRENQLGSQVLIDDYAHHPTEIKATIDAASQKYPDRSCRCFSATYIHKNANIFR